MSPLGAEGGAPSRRSGRRKGAVLITLLVVALAVTSLELLPGSTYSFDAPYAATLALSANGTSVAQGETLRLTLTDVNYLPFPNEPDRNFLFANQLNLSAGPCLAYPFGVAAYGGHFTIQNLSQSSRVDIFDSYGFYSCITALVPFRLGPLQTASRQVDIDGYWTPGQTAAPGGGVSEGVLHPLPTGPYTVVAADPWGHIQVCYFSVTAGAAPVPP